MRHLEIADRLTNGSADIKQTNTQQYDAKQSVAKQRNKQTRRKLQKSLELATAVPAILPTAKAVTFNLETATIADIHQAFKAETLTVERLVQFYLNRIEAYDKQGPAINSLISLNPDALAKARLLDQFMPRNLSPLYGIPIILKDNFNTADLPTTGGSAVLSGSIPPEDALVVKRLKEAGAIILGKANMSEFALSAGRMGYSSLGGLTLNPYDLEREASGSSSGSAAAIASNFAVFSTGSDTAGSIRGPASFAGLVGIKPTSGLISEEGIIPLSPSVEATGPMAKTVTDAAIGLGVMAGLCSGNSAKRGSADKPFRDYTQFLKAEALNGARVGVVRDFLGGNPEVDRIFEEALATMTDLGATVVKVKLSSDVLAPANYGRLLNAIVQSEFFPQIETYLQTLDGAYPKTLEALIEASLGSNLIDSDTPVNPNRIAVYKDSLATGGFSNSEYLAAIAQLSELRDAVFSTFSWHNLDALVYPTVGGLPSLIATDSRSESEASTSSHDVDATDPYRVGYLANLTGFPDITVPANFTELGLPVGLSFFAPAYSEPKLLGLAYAFEQATNVRRAPANTPPLLGETFEFEWLTGEALSHEKAA